MEEGKSNREEKSHFDGDISRTVGIMIGWPDKDKNIVRGNWHHLHARINHIAVMIIFVEVFKENKLS